MVTTLQERYEQARADADYDNQFLAQMTPALLSVGNLDRLAELEEQADLADAKTAMLYKQLHCKHEHTEYVGGDHVWMGEHWDDVRLVCMDCGCDDWDALDPHTASVSVLEEIPI